CMDTRKKNSTAGSRPSRPPPNNAGQNERYEQPPKTNRTGRTRAMTAQAPATPPRPADIDQGDDDDPRVDDDQRAHDEHPSSAQRDDDQGDDQRDDDQGNDDTFPRSYVQRLRERSNGYRLQLRERESEVETL